MVLSFSFHLSVCLLFYRLIYCSTVLLFNLSFCLPSYCSIFCSIVQSIAHLFNLLFCLLFYHSSLSFNVCLLIYRSIILLFSLLFYLAFYLVLSVHKVYKLSNILYFYQIFCETSIQSFFLLLNLFILILLPYIQI